MATKSPAAYDLGVGLGLASFQSSVSQSGLALAALADAKGSAELLLKANVIDQALFDSVFSNNVSQPHLVQVRQDVESNIRSRVNGNSIANVYQLALLIAMAEGQTTSGNWAAAVDLANGALRQADNLMSSDLPQIPWNRGLMSTALQLTENFSTNPGDAHGAVQEMRITFRGTVAESGLP